MESILQPYEIKTLEYGDGIFDKHIGATYIIHLRDTGREPHAG
jgi:hypothetical protein